VVTGLKGNVSYTETIPTGPYRNVKISFSQEFYLEDHDHEEILAGLIKRVQDSAEVYVLRREARTPR
jgi:hypothetical protein